MKLFKSTRQLGKIFLYVGLIATAVFSTLLPTQPVEAVQTTKITQIAVWGDSMTAVWGKYLQDLVGVPVSQNGVGGETIQQTQARFNKWTQPNTLHIVWSGHNNFTGRDANGQTVAPIIDKMAATKPSGQFWVMGLTNAPGIGISSVNTSTPRCVDCYQRVVKGLNVDLARKYGSSYVEMRGYLIANGLRDVGFTAMAGDKADIADDVPPRSLRTTIGNPGHLNDNGKRVVAGRLNTLIRSSGLLDGTAPVTPPPTTPPIVTPPTAPPANHDPSGKLIDLIRNFLKLFLG